MRWLRHQAPRCEYSPGVPNAFLNGCVGCVRLRVGQPNDLKKNSVWMDRCANEWPTETLQSPYDRLAEFSESDRLIIFFFFTDPCPPPPRVLSDLSPQEECQPCLRWLSLRWLCQGPHCACLPDWGAEDRQEGPQGVPAEGRQALSVLFVGVVLSRWSERYGKNGWEWFS